MTTVTRVDFARVPNDPANPPRYEVRGFDGDTVPHLLILDVERGGWSTYVFNKDGDLLGDSVHRTRNDAIREARDVFHIPREAWQTAEFDPPIEFNEVVLRVLDKVG